MSIRVRVFTAILAVSIAAVSAKVWALNGAQLTGFTAVNDSLGGSGVARPLDVSTLLVNPAGLTELPRMVNFNVIIGFPNSKMNTAAPTAVLGNAAAGTVQSNDDPVLLPGGGFNIPTSFFSDRLFVGFGLLPVAGFSVDFPASRLSPVFTANAYDTHTFYGLLKLLPAVAYKINDQWSVGLVLHINRQRLETNVAQAALPFPETAGGGRGDDAFGIGFGVGVLYKPLEWLQAGLTYTTEQWMQDFERYKDILPGGLNFPQQISAGLSIRPLQKFWVNTDFRWINWSGAGGGLGTPIAAGGFGWQDQYIAMLGLEYQPIDLLKVRAGYNYGRSTVSSGAAFANILAPTIGEHHLSTGVGFRISEKLNLDFSYIHILSNTVTDNGTQLAGAGAGAFAKQTANLVSSQVTLNF